MISNSHQPFATAYARRPVAAIAADADMLLIKLRRCIGSPPHADRRLGYSAIARIGATDQSFRAPYPGKNDPFRSWPISANELDDVFRGSDTKVRSPTVAVHSICALLRMNSPAKPPPSKGSALFRIFT